MVWAAATAASAYGTTVAHVCSRNALVRSTLNTEEGFDVALASPRQLFVHELEDMVSSENIIVKMLAELRKEAREQEAKDAFKEHEDETREQIKRLEKIFKLLG